MPDEIPEEISEDLEEDLKGLKDIKEEDIMWPEPSREQMAFWGEIEKAVTEENLKRENLFNALPTSVKDLLASEYTSNKIVEMSQKYNLNSDQATSLSAYIKSLFVSFRKEEELEVSKLTNLLRSNLDIDPGKAQSLFDDISDEILLPALKTVIAESDASEEPIEDEKVNPNIVDLKNQ